MTFKYLFIVILSLLIGNVASDFYTSTSKLELLVDAEERLVENLETYIKKLEEHNEIIRKYMEKIEEIGREIDADPAEYFENPLNAFQIIRRNVVDLKALELLLASDIETDAYAEVALQDMVKIEDLVGASQAFVRLQNVYDLDTMEMANGLLLEYEYDTSMSANDCFQLGRLLYDLREYRYALQWLTAARVRLERESLDKSGTSDLHFLTDVQILEFLAANYFNLGNSKMALLLNDELLALNPENEHGKMNRALYEKKIIEERNMIYGKGERQTLETKKSVVEDLYERTCRGELKQSPSQERNLRCRFASNNVPFGLLAPFKIEELNHDPPVTIFYDAIYPNEIKKIINETEDVVERSKVGDAPVSTYSEVRTSQQSWLWLNQHTFLHNLAQRLSDMTELSLESGEAMQVANYGLGGHYGPHYDFSEEPDIAYPGTGNRILTALFYINEVELGGATAFPFLHLAVPPTKGAAVVWHNMHQSLENDYRTKHAGCPVLKGSKWICNEWFHERAQEFKRPCSLNQTGYTSIKYKHII